MLPYGEDDDSEDSFMKEVAKEQISPVRRGPNFMIRQNTYRSQPIKVVRSTTQNGIKVLRTAKSRENIVIPSVDMPATDERYSKVRDYRMVWYPRSKGNATTGFMIDSKEGRSCIFHKDVCYIFGGYSPSTDQVFFQGYNMVTKKIFEIKCKITREPPPRAFHTCNYVDDMLIIFGGEIFSIYTDSRLMTNELILFNLKQSEYVKVNIHDNIDPRKHHASCILGSHLVIYGGVDEDSRTLNSFLTINLGKHTESVGLYSRPKDGVGAKLAWKKAPLSFEVRPASNHTLTPIYLNTPKGLSTANQKIKANSVVDTKKVALEGIYIFGGIDDNGKFSNSLQIVNTCNSSFDQVYDSWVLYPEHPLGIPPEPRSDHCAHYLPGQSMYIIYGGRDNSIYGLEGTFN